tara:strand:- start:371 stop:799 length:429 start_codon:yes stop_codon:yes gene_type:complete
MKIVYGNGIVSLFDCEYKDIILSIEYEGNIHLRHNFQELKNINKTFKAKSNIKNNNLIVNRNNIINIYLKNITNSDFELFKYIGYFKILKIKSNKYKSKIDFYNKGINYINRIETPFNKLDTPLNKLNASYIYGRIIRKLKR